MTHDVFSGPAESSGADSAARLADALTHADAADLTLSVGATRFAAPVQLSEVIARVLAAWAEGAAVRVMRVDQTLTPQQAADLLGMQCPTVAGLLDSGELPTRGSDLARRRVALADVMAYAETQRHRKLSALRNASRLLGDEGATAVRRRAVPAPRSTPGSDDDDAQPGG